MTTERRPARVLIADDEAYIRLLIEQTLEEYEEKGIEILTARDGQEALDIIRSEKPDLIFLDIMMPKIDGFEVCQTVKQHLNMTDCYVVMLTAKGQEFDRLRGEQVGADVFMTKPFDPDELIELTGKVLSIE
jgi:two-component system, OmpR family, alkaline phosphatase synthesis response regulator PhoP